MFTSPRGSGYKSVQFGIFTCNLAQKNGLFARFDLLLDLPYSTYQGIDQLSQFLHFLSQLTYLLTEKLIRRFALHEAPKEVIVIVAH